MQENGIRPMVDGNIMWPVQYPNGLFQAYSAFSFSHLAMSSVISILIIRQSRWRVTMSSNITMKLKLMHKL